MVRSVRPEAAIARTSAIGLRREPKPPIPIVMPDRSSPATCSGVSTSTGTSVPVHEGLPRLVRDSGQVELEGESLLVAIRPPDVHRFDAVQRLLGQPQDLRMLS